MEEYKNILIPVDGSEPAKHAVQKGLSLAKLIGAKVTALHVLEQPGFMTDMLSSGENLSMVDMGGKVSPGHKKSDILEGLKSEAHKALNFVREEGAKLNVEVEIKLVEGHPADQIVNISAEYDLVVLSALGKSCVSDLLMGGVADKVARHSKTPILLVR
jgi:nucleotide-binding universal stress UspA family protein